MIRIHRIKPDEVTAAKRVIYSVAHEIFNDRRRSLEESIAYHEARGELNDMDDIQRNYFENGGIFLIMLDENQPVGTGAIRKLKDDICELKRLWLLTYYHARGLGYRMLQELFAFAREYGLKQMPSTNHARWTSTGALVFMKLRATQPVQTILRWRCRYN